MKESYVTVVYSLKDPWHCKVQHGDLINAALYQKFDYEIKKYFFIVRKVVCDMSTINLLNIFIFKELNVADFRNVLSKFWLISIFFQKNYVQYKCLLQTKNNGGCVFIVFV